MVLEALPKTRSRFFLLRLALTALFLLLLAGVVCFIWYPGLTLRLTGSSRHLLVIVAVALAIGPGLSTLLYRPGKRGLLFDLVAVLVIELAAIGVVASDLYEKRPYFAVFAVDRFELVAAKEVDWANIRYEELTDKPFASPTLVYAKLPDDRALLSALIEETVLMGMADIDRRPEFWLPYSQGVDSVRNSLRPLEPAIAGGNATIIQSWLGTDGRRAEDFGYVPVRGHAADAAIIVERASSIPVAILNFDPW